MNRNLSPDERAELVLKEMTLDEKLTLIHGNGMRGWGEPRPNAYLGNGGAGFVLDVPRLGIPMIQMSDAAYGVRASAQNGRYSTALPSNIASAASWDTQSACEYGSLIGRELRAQGYNMTLGGGVNLTREPRNGRTFEYMGEDPILAGTLVGNRMKCEQAQHVMGDIKHYAMNDQESGRNEVNSVISKRAMRESDLFAFQLGIAIAQPAAVMCSYNAVNGDYGCENKYLLTDVLRKEWKFKGFVVSDWGATHSTLKASAAGLDQEQPLDDFYGSRYKEAVESGSIPLSELDEHVRRILRSEFASGIVDFPIQKSVVDVQAGLRTSRILAEHSIVLMKNENGVLPLNAGKLHSIAVIGPHADMGMISGGGSAQVDPPGSIEPKWQDKVWFPTSPLEAVRAKGANVHVAFDSGANPAAAAELAGKSDVALVFVYQWMSEDMDLPDLSLPENQDALIESVARANPRTIVILETGTAVTMPWLDKVSGVVEAWYAGSKGADAVANILFGDVNPSAKLPMTFPLNIADLPHPQLQKPPSDGIGLAAIMKSGEAKSTFEVHYDEGLKVGYKWYDAENKKVLFPFGFGLSYTKFAYTGLEVHSGDFITLTFNVKNTGAREGVEIAEAYATLPGDSGEPPKRLVGWSRVELQPGESKQVKLTIPKDYLFVFDETTNAEKCLPGEYTFHVGSSSRDLPLHGKMNLR
ncbi:MAG TPA: glycoside hydrolase family 3 C-terminal domain-containing protein [Candidatus Acidoferrum sp.]|nr:glycoside hydrolase family 3 C-terminal domain-containing protein [Candidatus Acidoferrum sp.]